jgi:hypothetical protein
MPGASPADRHPNRSGLSSSIEVIAMKHARGLSIVVGLGALCGIVACNKEQKAPADAGAQTALTLIGVDMGRHFDDDKKISDKTDIFAPNDTIYASVHTSGTANNGTVAGRWTFADGILLDEKTDSVTTKGDARSIFFIVKPGGFGTGKYTLHVLIDGREVRARDVTVK